MAAFDMGKASKRAMLGAAVAVLFKPLLSITSTWLSKIPGVSVDLQSISISTTGVGTVVDTGLSRFAAGVLTKVPFINGMDWITLAIGGAAFLVLGGLIYDNVKELQFAKGKIGKLATQIVIAGIVSGWILAGALAVPALTGIMVTAVNALIAALIISLIPVAKDYIV